MAKYLSFFLHFIIFKENKPYELLVLAYVRGRARDAPKAKRPEVEGRLRKLEKLYRVGKIKREVYGILKKKYEEEIGDQR